MSEQYYSPESFTLNESGDWELMDGESELTEGELETMFDDYIDELYPEPTVILGVNFYAVAIFKSDEAAYRGEFNNWLDYKVQNDELIEL